ncbi:MAG: EAL domain-containing protein [Beijerinckiaceae bacterium]|nr:EAL domain-containing protein [Beijerinckiaceae bacterium]
MSLIVIVDDRVTNRNIFAKLAASIEEDVTVRTFGDPAEALVWLSQQTPDLVITDYKMPQMDGAEFIRRFRLLPSSVDVPVVVITVYEERSFRLRALESGATDFLHSPVDHHEFVTRARNLLKLHKHQLLLASRASTLEKELEHSERSRERALRDSSERLAQVIDTLPVMISAAGYEGEVLFVNAFQTAFAGLDQSAVIGQPIAALLGEEHGARSYALDRMVFETGKALPSYEEDLIDRSGEKRVFLTTKSPLKDAANAVTGVLTSSLDISARKRTEAHLRHLAHHDPLTDLPNRTLLRERMRRLIARARRGDQLFALHLLDLDGFKAVNDLLGHSAGDRFIKAVGDRLRGAIREEDTLARLGGDEFAILQAHVTGPEDAAEFAQRVLQVVADGHGFEESTIRTTASIGIAIHPADGIDAEDLLKNADLAMYRAKAEKGNHFCFYAADMQARAKNEALLDAELRLGLEQEQFVLYYQPQVDLASGSIVGAEALLRWNRPGAGLVGPGVLLPRAEENGIIVPLNEWVLREACREAKSWQRMGLPPVRVGVNLSPVQFRKRTVPLLVAQVLAETGLDPRRLDLELTESIVVGDLEAVANDLQQLLDMGVHVSIDDFGTGYSSLSYVKRFPVDRLKIDQSFVRNLSSDPNDAAIVRAIITLGHSLDLEIVAEGVETAEQLARLRAEGCDEVQGYYFGKPMPAADFIELLRREPALARSA